MQRTILALSSLALVACLVACGGAGGTHPERGSTQKDARPIATKVLQDQREQTIQGIINEGVFKSVETGNHPVVVVTPKFMSLDFDDKQTFALVVAAYAYKIAEGDHLRPGEEVELKDQKSGKVVGVVSSAGLHMK